MTHTVPHTVSTSWPLPETAQSTGGPPVCAGPFVPSTPQCSSPFNISQSESTPPRGQSPKPSVAFASPPGSTHWASLAPLAGATAWHLGRSSARALSAVSRPLALFPPARPPILDLHLNPILTHPPPSILDLDPRPTSAPFLSLHALLTWSLRTHHRLVLGALAFDIRHSSFLAPAPWPSENCGDSSIAAPAIRVAPRALAVAVAAAAEPAVQHEDSHRF